MALIRRQQQSRYAVVIFRIDLSAFFQEELDDLRMTILRCSISRPFCREFLVR